MFKVTIQYKELRPTQPDLFHQSQDEYDWDMLIDSLCQFADQDLLYFQVECDPIDLYLAGKQLDAEIAEYEHD